MMKNNKGITLIALVVTIIVLLILAAVSIAMLTGNNGILTRASESSYTNTLGAAKDEVALKATELVTEYYKQVYVNANNQVSGANATTALDTFVKNGLADTAFDLPDNKKEVTYSCTGGAITLTYKAEPTHKVTGQCTNGKITWDPIQ